MPSEAPSSAASILPRPAPAPPARTRPASTLPVRRMPRAPTSGPPSTPRARTAKSCAALRAASSCSSAAAASSCRSVMGLPPTVSDFGVSVSALPSPFGGEGAFHETFQTVSTVSDRIPEIGESAVCPTPAGPDSERPRRRVLRLAGRLHGDDSRRVRLPLDVPPGREVEVQDVTAPHAPHPRGRARLPRRAQGHGSGDGRIRGRSPTPHEQASPAHGGHGRDRRGRGLPGHATCRGARRAGAQNGRQRSSARDRDGRSPAASRAVGHCGREPRRRRAQLRGAALLAGPAGRGEGSVPGVRGPVR